MKTFLIYVMIFTLAFFSTSGMLYLLNQNYVNVFSFDFRDNSVLYQLQTNNEENKDSKDRKDNIETIKPKEIKSDSLIVAKEANTIKKNAGNDKQKLLSELKQTKSDLQNYEKMVGQKDHQIESLQNKLNSRKDSTYNAWLSSTIKIYESLNAVKASQLLAKMDEEEARKILYAIKKKKAAEILSKLSTDKVIRLTKAE